MFARGAHDRFAEVDTPYVVPALTEPCDQIAGSATDVDDRAFLNPSSDQVSERLGAEIGAARFGESDLLPF
jgi:hypothetical protein